MLRIVWIFRGKERERVGGDKFRTPAAKVALRPRRARRGGVRFVKRRTVYIGDGKFICEMRIHSNRWVGSIITVIYIYTSI